MLPIVITTEGASHFEEECRVVRALIERFHCRVHLRKKHIDNTIITDIYDYYHRNIGVDNLEYITLHNSLDYVNMYNFGGCHISDSSSLMIAEGRDSGVVISTSCHTTEEVDSTKAHIAYLSPIFNSISKEGYMSAHTQSDIQQWLSCGRTGTKRVALGGINAGNIADIYRWGFDGAALLGAIWQNSNPIDEYHNILTKLNYKE